MLQNYPDTSSLNLAGEYPIDGGAGDAALPDLGAGDGGVIMNPVLTWDATADSAGSAASGALKIGVTFTAPKQYVDVIVNFSAPKDLTGKIVRVKLRQVSGNFSGGAQLHISTGADYGAYGSQGITGITPGTWVTGSLDTSVVTSATSEALDPAMSRQLGVQIFSGDPPTAGAGYPNAGEPVVFDVDTVVGN